MAESRTSGLVLGEIAVGADQPDVIPHRGLRYVEAFAVGKIAP